MSTTKISAAVLDVAGPFIEALPSTASDQARQDAVRLGVMAWNAQVLLSRGEPELWDELNTLLRSLPDQGAATMCSLLDEAASRRNARHADDPRIVTNWQLTIRGDGTASLHAEAVAPPAWVAEHGGRRDE